jgi:O-antigen ligase/lipoprotein NlpI
MAKKQQVKEAAYPKTPVSRPKSQRLSFSFRDLVPIICCLLYLAVHFIPDFGAYDAMGSQWLYLVIIDCLVIIYILADKDRYSIGASAIGKNIFSKLYVAFFLLAGLSTFIAINPTEAWVCYVRIIATIVAYFNLSIILYGRSDLFRWLAQLLGLILLVESVQTISQFLNELGGMPLTDLILSLKGTTGNKNIFAADLVVKIPFVFYCIHTFRLWGKLFNVAILTIAAFTIFIINARATYISLLMILILYAVYCLSEYRKEKKTEETMFRLGYIFIPIILAFFVAQAEMATAKSLQDQGQVYGTVSERFSSITSLNTEDNQVRLRLWAHAMDYTSHHPVIGCGIGNWKIASIPYQRTITNNLIVPVHAHNDFAEMFAELGIPGGLLYLSIFTCILFFAVKVFLSHADEETKLISLFTFLAFIGYSIDAFFNFPLERPISQLFFALIVSLNVTAYLKSRKELTKENARPSTSVAKSIIGLTAILFLLPAGYVTYQTYRSLVAQRSIVPDLDNEPLKLNYKEIFPLIPPIPNLSASAQPLDAIKGRYLYEAGKYDEALVLMNKGMVANPAIAYSEFLKAGLYFRTGKLDSSKANALKAFYTRPRANTYYQTLIAVLARMHDTTEIQKAFDEAIRYRKESYVWNMYLTGMLNALQLHSNAKLLAMSDSALHYFPDDKNLLQRKQEILSTLPNTAIAGQPARSAETLNKANQYYAAGVEAFSKGDFATAAQDFVKSSHLNVINYAVYENAGICYFNMKDYKNAVSYFDKVLAMKTSSDGKSEFFKGVSLINLGRKDEGCRFLQTAKAKGYKEAEGIIATNCK